MVRIDTQEKLDCRFMGYQEAIDIMKNYKYDKAVDVLEDCLKSKHKVLNALKSLWEEMQKYKKDKLLS